MAHNITYKPTGIIMSSSIGDIGITVDGDFVDVLLTGPCNAVLLSERYYAYGRNVRLYDIASLIEDYMRSSGVSFEKFTLTAYTDTTGNKADSWTMNVLYCDRYTLCTDLPTFLRENFLCALSTRRIATDTIVSLFYYAEKGESRKYTVSYTCRLKDGSFHRSYFYKDSTLTVNAPGIIQLNINYADIIDDAAHEVASELRQDIQLVAFTLSCGQRSISFFIDPTLNDRNTLYFRNCFNVWDFVALPAITTAKTDVERTIATVNGVSQFYNQTATKTYEVNVGPLTSDEVEWIDQLFTSYEVFRIEPNPCDEYDPLLMAPILITDSTCETQDGDTELNYVKFTCRFADNRPIIRLSASPGIFTSPYNIVYS